MDTTNLIEISGIVIAIVLGIVSYLNSKTDWQNYYSKISIPLLLIIITLILSIRYNVIPRIEKNQLLAKQINENPMAYQRLFKQIAIVKSLFKSFARLQNFSTQC